MPDLARGTPAEGRGVEDDAVIHCSPARLALSKCECVVGDPANSVLRKAGEPRVLMRPIEGLLRSVHMGHLCSGVGGHESGDTRIAEEVQDVRATERLHAVLNPDPIRLLLGEDAGVLEAREPREEVDRPT